MSHVDEGLIHAWLDGAFAPDDPEHARIEAHLAGCEACRRAVEVERRIRERATDVLGMAAPDAVRVEPFQRILDARRGRKGSGLGSGSGLNVGSGPETDISSGAAGVASDSDNGSGGDDAMTQDERAKPGRGFRFPMALAATLVLALGATWFARQMMQDGLAAPEMQVMDEAGEQDAVANSAATPAAPSVAPSPAPGVSARERSESEAAERTAAAPPPSRQEVAAADIVPPSVVTGAQVGTTAVAGRSAEAQALVPPPAAADQRNRTPAETRRLAAQAMMDSMIRNVGDSALRLEGVVVTGAAASPAQFADADAVIAVDRLGDAGGTVVWTPADPDTVAARFGMRPLGLTGLDADSVQIGLVAGATVARTIYTVNGQPVELLQWVTGSLNAENEQFRQPADQLERRSAAAAGVRADAADVAAKAVAPVAPAAYRLEGIDFVLRGTVPADSLAGLAVRVGRVE